MLYLLQGNIALITKIRCVNIGKQSNQNQEKVGKYMVLGASWVMIIITVWPARNSPAGWMVTYRA